MFKKLNNFQERWNLQTPGEFNVAIEITVFPLSPDKHVVDSAASMNRIYAIRKKCHTFKPGFDEQFFLDRDYFYRNFGNEFASTHSKDYL